MAKREQESGPRLDQGLHLRPMLPQDVDLIMPIEAECFEFPWTPGMFHDCLKVGYSSWVAEDANGRIVGYTLMSMAAGEGHILNISVDPNLRGRGYGRVLLAHLLAIAEAAELEILLLEVRPSNTVALRMYESAAFRQIGRRKRYYPAAKDSGGREDAVVYARQWARAATTPTPSSPQN